MHSYLYFCAGLGRYKCCFTVNKHASLPELMEMWLWSPCVTTSAELHGGSASAKGWSQVCCFKRTTWRLKSVSEWKLALLLVVVHMMASSVCLLSGATMWFCVKQKPDCRELTTLESETEDAQRKIMAASTVVLYTSPLECRKMRPGSNQPHWRAIYLNDYKTLK